MTKTFSIETNSKYQLIDITNNVLQVVSQDSNGIAIIFVNHTTAAIVITETGENLDEDIFTFLKSITLNGPYSHSHGDFSHTPSHIFSALFGQSRSVPVSKGKLSLGTWQRICLLELNGPRTRTITVTTIEEK